MMKSELQSEAEEKIFCQNCQRVTRVVKNHCEACREMICRVCGCTDSEPCMGTCSWVEPGLCSNCENGDEGVII